MESVLPFSPALAALDIELVNLVHQILPVAASGYTRHRANAPQDCLVQADIKRLDSGEPLLPDFELRLQE